MRKTDAVSEPTRLTVATDLTLILSDRVGSLAETLRTLGNAGVNVLGHGGFPAWAGEGILHLIVDDPEQARAALAAGGIEIREQRDVVVATVENAPGSLASLFERIASANVSIDLTYALADGRVAIGVQNVDRSIRAISETA
jgi:hypothetical protein